MSGNKGVISRGGDTVYFDFVTGQSSVTAGVTEIVTIDRYRGKTYFCNNSTNTNVYISTSSSVATTDGFLLPPQTPVWIPVAGTFYGIAASGTVPVSYGECK